MFNPSPSVTLPALDGHKRVCVRGCFERVVNDVDQGRATFLVRPCTNFAHDGFCSCAADEAV